MKQHCLFSHTELPQKLFDKCQYFECPLCGAIRKAEIKTIYCDEGSPVFADHYEANVNRKIRYQLVEGKWRLKTPPQRMEFIPMEIVQAHRNLPDPYKNKGDREDEE